MDNLSAGDVFGAMKLTVIAGKCDTSCLADTWGYRTWEHELLEVIVLIVYFVGASAQTVVELKVLRYRVKILASNFLQQNELKQENHFPSHTHRYFIRALCKSCGKVQRN